MTVSKNSETNPVLLVKCFQSREQSWTGFGQAQCRYALSEEPKLRDLSEDQDNMSLVQKTHWRSLTSCRKFWWLDNSRSQSSQWRMWISTQSSIRCGGGRFGNSVVTILPVQNKNFWGNTKELAKVLGARQEAWSHIYWQFLGIWQSLWRSFLESLYVNTT